MVSSVVMVIILGGVLATLLHSRRLTEGSIFQNSTVTIMQGYIEQIKNMEFAQVNVSPATTPSTPVTLATVQDQTTADPLTVSVGTPPSTMPAVGVTPTGAVNNNKVFDINNTPTIANDNLNLNIWVWVQDLTGTAANVTNAKAITMIYTWQVRDGNRTRSYRGSVRTVRSLVPSY